MTPKMQPKIEKGTTFTGWATFNWGMSHDRVYRTRKQAKEALIGNNSGNLTWHDIKGHMTVVKVKCTVL